MATVYSLVCWGGKDGKTVTMTIASPCVVTITNHGLRDGTGVVFSTTGVLPTGITAGTTYYAKSTASGTFNLYDTAAHAIAGGSTGIVNTSGSQSGTHNAKGAYYLGLVDKSRWMTDSTERIYDGVASWHAARSSAGVGSNDTEVCELGQGFVDYFSSGLTLNLACAAITVTSLMGASRSAAFHAGTVNTGYMIQSTNTWQTLLTISTYNVTLDGFSIYLYNGGALGVLVSQSLATLSNLVIFGRDGQSYTNGINLDATTSVAKVFNNLIISCAEKGINVGAYKGELSYIYNNLVTKCTIGFAASSAYGFYYNNISIGNSTNWNTAPSSAYAMKNNAGLAADPVWDSGSTRITIATSDFTDYSNNVFTPALSSSPQVNTGLNIFEGYAYDISGDERPNYEAATYPNNVWDVGPFEFDHGEGLAPQSVPISITGMASGSEIAIYKSSDMSAILAPQSTTGSYSGTYTYTGDTNIIVRVRKGTSATRYLPYEYAGTITSTGFALVVSQIVDTIA